MFVPDRPVEDDPVFQRMWGDADLCPNCDAEMRNIRDNDHPCLLCPHCDLDEPFNNDVRFNLHFYGMTECQGFENGIIDDSRADMYETQKWWKENLQWEIAEYHNEQFIPADIRNGNDAGQWFVFHRGNQIACITEIMDG